MSVPTGFVLVQQTKLMDVNGNPANAQVVAQAVDALGNATSVRVAGGGITTISAVAAQCVNGAWSMNLPDMHLSQPANLGFAFTATDNTSGAHLIGPGYNFVQPGSDPTAPGWNGLVFNFDILPPTAKPTIVTIAQGPKGDPPTFRGVYSAAVTYGLNDAVSFGDSSYVSLVASNQGHMPGASPTSWAVLAAGAGTAGPALIQGNLSTMRNLIDPAKLVASTLINCQTGVATSFSGFTATGYVPVGGLTSLVCSKDTSTAQGIWGFAFYDSNLAYISGATGAIAGTVISVPAGAYYVRVGIPVTLNPAGAMIVPGAILPSQFIAFGQMDPATGSSLAVDSFLGGISPLTNLFDYAKAKTGIIQSNGVFNAGIAFLASDYMPVHGLPSIVSNSTTNGTTNGGYGWCFYDAAKNFMSCVIMPILAGQVIPVPAGACYLRAFFDPNDHPRLQTICAGTVAQPYSPPVGAPPVVLNTRWLGKNYGCVGDSITQNGTDGVFAGSGPGSQYPGYQTAVAYRLGMTLAIDNGYGGKRMVDFLTFSGFTTITNQTTVQALDVITFFFGTNDFDQGVPLGTATDTTAASFYGAINQIIQTVTGWKPTIKIVFILPLQRWDSVHPETVTNSLGLHLTDYVQAIRAKCIQYGLPYVDLHDRSGLNSLNSATYTIDGLHPNPAGYAACVTPLIASTIASL